MLNMRSTGRHSPCRLGCTTAVRMATAAILVVAFAGVALVLADAPAPAAVDPGKLPPPAARPVDFVKDVQPIFAANCYACHGPDKQKSGYRLDAKSVALAGGDIGHAIIPGDGANSRLIHDVSGLDPKIKMPAKGDPLTAEQVGILRAWIDQGANWPDEASVKVDDGRGHWAYQPLAKPAV